MREGNGRGVQINLHPSFTPALHITPSVEGLCWHLTQRSSQHRDRLCFQNQDGIWILFAGQQTQAWPGHTMGGGKGQGITRLTDHPALRQSKGPRVGAAPYQRNLRLHALPVPRWHGTKGSHALTSLLSTAGFQQSPSMLSCRAGDRICRGTVGLSKEQPLLYLAALWQYSLQGDMYLWLGLTKNN